MSRGHGRVMKAVRSAIPPKGWISIAELALGEVESDTERGSRARLESIRRACKKLAAEGYVELGYRSLSGRVSEIPPTAGEPLAELVARRKSFSKRRE